MQHSRFDLTLRSACLDTLFTGTLDSHSTVGGDGGCRVGEVRALLKQSKVKFLFIAISGIYLGIFEGSHGSYRAAPEHICLPTMTQAGCEHAMQCISLVHADAPCIAPQR